MIHSNVSKLSDKQRAQHKRHIGKRKAITGIENNFQKLPFTYATQ